GPSCGAGTTGQRSSPRWPHVIRLPSARSKRRCLTSPMSGNANCRFLPRSQRPTPLLLDHARSRPPTPKSALWTAPGPGTTTSPRFPPTKRCPASVRHCAPPLVTSQISHWDPLYVAPSSRSSRLNCGGRAPPSLLSNSLPVIGSHSLRIQSQPTLASRSPAELKTTVVTGSLWPRNTACRRSCSTSHVSMVCSFVLRARYRPQGCQATTPAPDCTGSVRVTLPVAVSQTRTPPCCEPASAS